VRLCLLVLLAILLGRALHAFLTGISPFAEDSLALRLMPVVIGAAILFTLVAAVRAAIGIVRDLRR
jgi:hypothetical protein